MDEERKALLKVMEYMQKFNKFKFYAGYNHVKNILQKIMIEHYKQGYAEIYSLRKYHTLYYQEGTSYINLFKVIDIFLDKIGFEGNFKMFATECYEEMVYDPLLDSETEGDDEF